MRNLFLAWLCLTTTARLCGGMAEQERTYFRSSDGASQSACTNTRKRDGAAIDRLHRQIVVATLSGQSEQLANLWDENGVRLTLGAPAEVGRTTIEADNRTARAT